MSAATDHPVFKDGQPVQKSSARVYLGIKLPNADALRALDMSQTGIVWVGTEQWWRDASDTVSADDGVTVIVDAAGNRWKVITGSTGIQINAAGAVADRSDFDDEEPPFAYYATDEELLYVKNSDASADWSAGFSIKGEDGESIPVTGTSTTSLTPGAGNKVFTTQEGRGWADGQRLRAASDNGAIFVEGPATYSGDQLTIAADLWRGDSAHADWNIAAAGEPGKAFAFSLVWDEDNTDSDPGDGEVKADADDLSAATKLYIDDLDRFGQAIAAALLVAGAVDNTVKADLTLQSEGGNARADFTVDIVADESGYVRYGIDDHSGATGFTAGARVLLTVRPRSNKGADGANGLDGLDYGLPFTFRSKTDVEEPDNLGDFNFDNAALASVTKLVISKFTASAGNPDTLGAIAQWWAGGSTSDRARVTIKSRANESEFVTGTISGDGTFHDETTDWYEIPFTDVAGSGITAGALCSIEVTASGPEGVITGGVDSFNGRSGAVVPAASDYDADQVDYDNSGSGLTATDTQAAIDEVEERVAINEADIADLETDKLDAGGAAAVSVTGRSANSTGARADIVAGANDRILARVSDALSWVQATFGMIASAAIASASEFRSKTASKILTAEATLDAALSASLTDAATIVFDMNGGWNRHVTITDDRTLGNPSNVKNDISGKIEVTASGADRDLDLDSSWENRSGETFPITIPSGTTTDLMYYTRSDGTPVIAAVLAEP